MAELAFTGIYGDLMVTGDSQLLGNVGINIKTPADVLDVGGNVRITGSLRTRSSILNFENAGGSLVHVRAATMTIAQDTSVGYEANANCLYVQSRIGVGRKDTEGISIDAQAHIRTQGQLMSKVTGSPPLVVDSNIFVPNLNVDRLDNFEAKDIFNSIISCTGDGVIDGLKVQPVTGLQIQYTSGNIIAADYGTMYVSGANISSPLSAGNKYIVFVVGKAGLLDSVNVGVGTIVVKGGVSLPSIGTWSTLNPILLATIDVPSGAGAILSSHITDCRKMALITSSILDEKINIFPSDNINVTQSSNYGVTNRIEMSKAGDSVLVKLSNIYNPGSAFNNVRKNLQLYPDKIVLEERDSGGSNVLSTKEIDKTKVDSWDNANSLKHTHYYNAPYFIEDNGYRLRLNTVKTSVNRDSFRIYVNGLRKKKGVDYIDDAISTAVRFDYPLVELTDTIVLDYDE